MLLAADSVVHAQPPATSPRKTEIEALRNQLEKISERLRELEHREAEAAAAPAKATAARPVTPAVTADADDEDESREIEWRGYLTAAYEQYDFFRNAQDDDPERRARTDLERVVLEAERELSDDWRVEAELEFEHGGTGSAVEFEPEEFGEFEQEIEQGGEVRVEYAYLAWNRIRASACGSDSCWCRSAWSTLIICRPNILPCDVHWSRPRCCPACGARPACRPMGHWAIFTTARRSLTGSIPAVSTP